MENLFRALLGPAARRARALPGGIAGATEAPGGRAPSRGLCQELDTAGNPKGEPIHVLNMFLKPIPGGTEITVSEIQGALWVVDAPGVTQAMDIGGRVARTLPEGIPARGAASGPSRGSCRLYERRGDPASLAEEPVEVVNPWYSPVPGDTDILVDEQDGELFVLAAPGVTKPDLHIKP